jgi:hypothetical protein
MNKPADPAGHFRRAISAVGGRQAVAIRPRSRLEALLDEGEAMTRKAIELALAGSETALRLCLNLSSPRRRLVAAIAVRHPTAKGIRERRHRKAVAGVRSRPVKWCSWQAFWKFGRQSKRSSLSRVADVERAQASREER